MESDQEWDTILVINFWSRSQKPASHRAPSQNRKTLMTSSSAFFFQAGAKKKSSFGITHNRKISIFRQLRFATPGDSQLSNAVIFTATTERELGIQASWEQLLILLFSALIYWSLSEILMLKCAKICVSNWLWHLFRRLKQLLNIEADAEHCWFNLVTIKARGK